MNNKNIPYYICGIAENGKILYCFEGIVDEFRVYNNIKAAEQILILYESFVLKLWGNIQKRVHLLQLNYDNYLMQMKSEISSADVLPL